jgi:hypothetical protein
MVNLSVQCHGDLLDLTRRIMLDRSPTTKTQKSFTLSRTRSVRFGPLHFVIWSTKGVGMFQAKALLEKCIKGEDAVFSIKWFII